MMPLLLRRLSLLLALGTGITYVGTIALADPGEEERARAVRTPAVLPDPDQTSKPRKDAQPAWFATRVLDARTLEPIAGARWIRTPEWIAGWRLHHDVVLGLAVTDTEGIAYLPTEPQACSGDCHWLVRAPGYATGYAYGVRPEPETLLEPEAIQRGRVLDPLGRPAVGARVEHLGGCSHGTAASQARTGADGSFLLRRLPAALDGQLWIEGQDVAATLLALDQQPSLGTRGVELVMEPGPRLEGRLVDLLGQPICGAVIRAWNAQRGPTAMSDAEGHFVIDGAATDSALFIYAPGDLLDSDQFRRVDGARRGTPIHVVVSPLGIVEEDETATVHLRARGTDGELVGGVACCLVNVTTGLGSACDTEGVPTPEGDASSLEEGLEAVAPGRYRIVPDTPFDQYVFDPVEVTAVANTTVAAEIVVRPRPRLKVMGVIPDDASLSLAVPGPFVVDAWDATDGSLSLPADGLAVLRVACEGRPSFFFPVGPEQGGVRAVTVALPPPRLLQLPAGAREVALRDGAREVVGFRHGAFYATDASGALTLTWEDAKGRVYELPIVVPQQSEAVIRIDAAKARVAAGLVSVVAVAPGEALPPVDDWEAVWPGETATFERPGWRRLRGVAPRAEKLVLRWGPCSLRLQVTYGAEPADVLALIAGEVYALPEGRLELKGFEPGRIRILVGPRDALEGVVEVYTVLKAGDVAQPKIDLNAD